MTFSELIRAKGFTSVSLAEKSGVSRRTIELYRSRHESLDNAHAGIVADLADALGVTVRDLLELDPPKVEKGE